MKAIVGAFKISMIVKTFPALVVRTLALAGLVLVSMRVTVVVTMMVKMARVRSEDTPPAVTRGHCPPQHSHYVQDSCSFVFSLHIFRYII